MLFFINKNYVGAFYIFIIAGFTDCLDGWIARYFSCKTRLGSLIDPLADKLMVAVSFIALAVIHQLPWWLVSLVFMRDLTISLGVIAWYWLINRKLIFKPTLLSKINTTLQLCLVVLCLFELAFSLSYNLLIQIVVGCTTITTSLTYINYVLTWSKKACSTYNVAQ